MSGLEGLKLLVVEDEPIVAMMLEDMLEELGCHVVACAASVEEGLRLAEAGGFDAALLDVNLNGRRSDPIAERLGAAGIPHVYTTGYGAAAVEAGRQLAILQKPYTRAQLCAVLERVASS